MQTHTLPNIAEYEGSLTGKYVFLRASLNVPLENGVITNLFRLTRGLPTLEHLVKEGARIILAGHIGRDEEDTLFPVYEALKSKFNIHWSEHTSGDSVVRMRDSLQDGEILMLENLRQNSREKDNDPEFAKELASLAEVYVNDAFAASHREHASIIGVPKYLPGYFGFNFIQEYEELEKVKEFERPSLFILGGAKFETKIPLVKKYAKTFDHIFIGGALANDFFLAKGYEMGNSLVSDIDLDMQSLTTIENILLPIDVTVLGKNGMRIVTPDRVESHESVLDIGPKTMEMLKPYIDEARGILWNGPLGNYEHGFNTHTEECVRYIVSSNAHSIVGGGDTIAAIEALALGDKFGFVSTAGGAMLTFLEGGTMVGIDAIINK